MRNFQIPVCHIVHLACNALLAPTSIFLAGLGELEFLVLESPYTSSDNEIMRLLTGSAVLKLYTEMQ
jgi:hypothetical protein